MIKYFLRRLSKSERGATIVEFAIVIPILLTLIFGIIEFGWIFNGYITLNGAAKEGVRLAIVDAKDGDIKEAVKKYAMTFHIEDEEIIINIGQKRGVETTVTVNGDLPLLVGFFPFIDNPFPMEATAIMIQER